jgi:hypothetical protein
MADDHRLAPHSFDWRVVTYVDLEPESIVSRVAGIRSCTQV